MRASRRVLLTLIAGFVLSLWHIWRWNQSFIDAEAEAPLDHWWANVQKPLFRGTCPVIPISNATLAISIYMLSARPPMHVTPVLESWQSAGLPVSILDTGEVSKTLALAAECQNRTFKGRLFRVYQYVMTEILSDLAASSTHVMILEDDALLLDAPALLSEVQYATDHGYDFYSLFRTGNGCLYDYGAVAGVYSAQLLERMLELPPSTTCRLPIDMWLAQHGPWYVTQRDLIKHVGQRLHHVPP